MVDFLKSSLEHYFAFVVDLESSFEIVDWFVFIFFVSGIKVYNSLEIFCYLLEKKGDRYWRIELIIKVERRTSFVTIVLVY